jgi:hypothetical protein
MFILFMLTTETECWPTICENRNKNTKIVKILKAMKWNYCLLCPQRWVRCLLKYTKERSNYDYSSCVAKEAFLEAKGVPGVLPPTPSLPATSACLTVEPWPVI